MSRPPEPPALPLRGALCSLRRMLPRDVPALLQAADDREVWRTLRDQFPSPYEQADAEQWLALTRAQDPPLDLVIAEGERLVGFIGVKLLDDIERFSGELGYWLGRQAWGRGLATDAVRTFAPWIARVHGLRRLQAEVFEGNPASCRVLEKAGFQVEGRSIQAAFKDGRFLDLLHYGQVLSPE